MKLLKSLGLLGLLILIWQLSYLLFHIPDFILPSPYQILLAAYQNKTLIWINSIPTLLEMIIGLLIGFFIGSLAALSMRTIPIFNKILLPMILASQAIPIFVIAPIFVLWFGYGLLPKVFIVAFITFFPITSNFYDGLKNFPLKYQDLAKSMNAKKHRQLWFMEIPYALPHLASGFKIAITFAPMAAVISEWVGSNQGLGYLLISSNAQMDIALTFAVVFIIIFFACIFYLIPTYLIKYFIFWHRELS